LAGSHPQVVVPNGGGELVPAAFIVLKIFQTAIGARKSALSGNIRQTQESVMAATYTAAQ
jgi:hypothetical protein